MVSVQIGRSTATLLALSTRRNFVLPSSAFPSLIISAFPHSSSALALAPLSSPPPSIRIRRYRTSSATLCAAVADESSSCLNPPAEDTSSKRIMNDPQDTGYLSAQDAAALDAELMSTPGFSLEQLMELAGLAVAEAVYDVLVVGSEHDTSEATKARKHVLLVCGPGNNGGDGLVAARHLVHFGLSATIVYPKHSTKAHFINLVKQCEDLGIPILDTVPIEVSDEPRYDGIVDAIFGFSFSGSPPREPYASAIASMMELRQRQKSIMISVDVPSGWKVNGTDDDSPSDAATNNTFLQPDVLISLTVPKLFAKKFKGRHFIGGRFLPPKLAEKYGIRMPPYPGKSQVMEIS